MHALDDAGVLRVVVCCCRRSDLFGLKHFAANYTTLQVSWCHALCYKVDALWVPYAHC
jgi:hypothetical protein